MKFKYMKLLKWCFNLFVMALRIAFFNDSSHMLTKPAFI